jgi:hypothetical protein
MERLVADPERCLAFVQRQEPLAWSDGMKGIGLERDGELVAVAVYEGWSGSNIWMHTAKEPGVTLTSRAFFAAAFDYPFNQLKVRRASAYVEEVNVAANRIARHLGFKPEARLEGVARAGGDVIIYRMWRDECRFILRSA